MGRGHVGPFAKRPASGARGSGGEGGRPLFGAGCASTTATRSSPFESISPYSPVCGSSSMPNVCISAPSSAASENEMRGAFASALVGASEIVRRGPAALGSPKNCTAPSAPTASTPTKANAAVRWLSCGRRRAGFGGCFGAKPRMFTRGRIIAARIAEFAPAVTRTAGRFTLIYQAQLPLAGAGAESFRNRALAQELHCAAELIIVLSVPVFRRLIVRNVRRAAVRAGFVVERVRQIFFRHREALQTLNLGSVDAAGGDFH